LGEETSNFGGDLFSATMINYYMPRVPLLFGSRFGGSVAGGGGSVAAFRRPTTAMTSSKTMSVLVPSKIDWPASARIRLRDVEG